MAIHLEGKQGIFSEHDKANTKALREAEAFIHQDNREFNNRKKDIKKKGAQDLKKGFIPLGEHLFRMLGLICGP